MSNLPVEVQERGLEPATWLTLKNSIFVGAKEESILMAVDYCIARGLDVLQKPVHIVPMYVRDSQTNQSHYRDVIMVGIGLYRIQADRSQTYAGSDEPEFGPTLTSKIDGVEFSYPEWCKYTVHKIVGQNIVSFSAKEYWLENYATAGKNTGSPNAMWRKRPFGQLAKCTEAQALRKAWPEIGQAPTAEEMEGKEYLEKDVTPKPDVPNSNSLPPCPDDRFMAVFKRGKEAVETNSSTTDQIKEFLEAKYSLSASQIEAIDNLDVKGEEHENA